MSFDKRRDEVKADAPDQPRPRRHHPKSTKRWCKGKVGVEHQPGEPEANHNYGFTTKWNTPLCHVSPAWARGVRGIRGWWCNHYIRCKVCRKILRQDLGEDCPDRPAAEQLDEPRKVYTANVTADVTAAGSFWSIYVPEIDYMTQARFPEEIESMARDLIAIIEDVEMDSFDLTIVEGSPSP